MLAYTVGVLCIVPRTGADVLSGSPADGHDACKTKLVREAHVPILCREVHCYMLVSDDHCLVDGLMAMQPLVGLPAGQAVALEA